MSLTPREVTSGTTDTPTSSDSDKIVRISSTTGDMVVTLDTEANQSWNNEIFYVERATVNTVSISPASGVTMFLPDGSTITNGTVLTIPFQNGVIYLKHQGTGTDDWTVGGDIGSILGVPAVETGTTLTVGSEHIDALVRCSNTSAITVTFAVDADIPIGASGEIVQWGNGALSLTGSAVVLVSLDGDLTLSGLYASVVWTKIDATTYLIRGALAVETVAFPTGTNPASAETQYRIPGWSYTNNTTIALTADRAYYSYWYTDAPIVLTGLQLQVTTAGGTVLRVAVVKLDEDWQPNAEGLVGQTTVDPSSTGEKVVTGLTWVCEPGIYATVVVADSTPTLRVGIGALGVGAFARIYGSTNAQMGVANSVGTSAFADPVPDWTAHLSGNSGSHHLVAFETEAA